MQDDKGTPFPVADKVVAIYNYKGGVCKTTSVINLAATYIDKGKRVLVVDADPQCNLTMFFFPYLDEEDDADEQEEVIVLPAEEQQNCLEPKIMSHPLNPRAEPLTEDVLRHNFTTNNLMELVNYYMTNDIVVVPNDDNEGDHNGMYPDELKPQDVNPEMYGGNLMLVPGSYNLDLLDDDLEGNTDVQHPLAQTNRYIGSFRKALNDQICRFRIDVVLIDCAPANSRINKIIAMTSDFIIPPVFPDYYSMASVHGLLHHVLPRWFAWRADHALAQPQGAAGSDILPHVHACAFQVSAFQSPSQDQIKDMTPNMRRALNHPSYTLSSIAANPPRILPFLVQNLELDNRKKSTKDAPKPPRLVRLLQSRWVGGLVNLVGSPSVPVIVRDQYRPNHGRMVVPFMRALQTAYTWSHECGLPIVHLHRPNPNGETDNADPSPYHTLDDLISGGMTSKGRTSLSAIRDYVNRSKEGFASAVQFLLYMQELGVP
eukprot:362998-Chlamydomonas_euryale.AAC.4